MIWSESWYGTMLCNLVSIGLLSAYFPGDLGMQALAMGYGFIGYETVRARRS